MISVLKEPFLHFLLIGAAVFVIKGFWDSPPPETENPVDTQIVITSDVMKSLKSRLPEKIRSKNPDSAQYRRMLNEALEQYTQDEMFFREAKSRQLDENDVTVRQHLISKLKQLAMAKASADPFPESQIAAYYAQHREIFFVEGHADVDQIFFDTAKRGDGARADCDAVWQRIQNDADMPPETMETFGDRRHGYRYHMTALNRKRLTAKFGHSIADTIIAVEQPGWLPPVESPDGWQLIRVAQITKDSYEPLDKVRSEIIYQLEMERNEQAATNLYEQLKKKYQVIKE